ncbi:MAG: co-chaperone GroES [Anaerolineae bacterium]|nr:co-chaperone GroES [Anaerolineae bacterium]
MSLKLRPLNDRVVVKPIDKEETFAGGQLVLPETAKEKPQQGEVLAVGPGRFDEDGEKRLPLDVAVGDRVLYAKYGGTEIKIDNEKLLILKESDILAVIED